MYAVIESGGKQHRVQTGDIIQVEKIEGDKGAKVTFDRVLFMAISKDENPEIWIGKPTLSGAKVEGEIVGQGRDKKILIIKMKRRKQYHRTQGHRQYQTHLLITGLDNGTGVKIEIPTERYQEIKKKFSSHLTPKGGRPKKLRKTPASKSKEANVSEVAGASKTTDLSSDKKSQTQVTNPS